MTEETVLAGVVGTALPEQWGVGPAADFHDVKADLETILASVGAQGGSAGGRHAPCFATRRTARLYDAASIWDGSVSCIRA